MHPTKAHDLPDTNLSLAANLFINSGEYEDFAPNPLRRIAIRVSLFQIGLSLIDMCLIFAMSVSGCDPKEITHGATVLIIFTFVWGVIAWKIIGRSWFDPFFSAVSGSLYVQLWSICD